MRSIDAGISSVDCGERVAVTTTVSTCANAGVHAPSASAPSVLLISARLPRMRTRVCLAAFLLLYAGLAWCEADPTLLPKLRQGGYVLFLRHTSTDFSQNDARMTSFEDCANQRNLLDKGRDEARALGMQIKRLGIPIGTVYASPFCRTLETARLAFGGAEKTNEARGGPANTNDPTRYDPLRKLLAIRPPPGKNNVIASHGNPFYAVFGPPYLAEGEIAVVEPSAFVVVGKIRIEDWQAFH